MRVEKYGELEFTLIYSSIPKNNLRGMSYRQPTKPAYSLRIQERHHERRRRRPVHPRGRAAPCGDLRVLPARARPPAGRAEPADAAVALLLHQEGGVQAGGGVHRGQAPHVIWDPEIYFYFYEILFQLHSFFCFPLCRFMS